ncbi:MAG: hypothetical protein KAH21_12395 [Spirochaetaceae bacterium]|nr:hypothetical protein [Spirochaetaceae bacterium]
MHYHKSELSFLDDPQKTLQFSVFQTLDMEIPLGFIERLRYDDIRHSWRDGEKTRAFEDADGVEYDNKGSVYCISPHYADQKTMPCSGFDKDRNTLKYSYTAEHYGMECRDKERCKIPKQVRIPLSEDRRIFSPVARSSYKWNKLYNSRTAAERVNSRIDKMFGFENHTIRGLDTGRYTLICSIFISSTTFDHISS